MISRVICIGFDVGWAHGTGDMSETILIECYGMEDTCKAKTAPKRHQAFVSIGEIISPISTTSSAAWTIGALSQTGVVLLGTKPDKQHLLISSAPITFLQLPTESLWA